MRTGRHFLHTPGPTHIPERVLSAMHRQPIDFTDREMVDLTARIFERMKHVFQTGGEVFTYISNGHGGWEAAVANLLAPGDTALLPITGHFALGWTDHARALGVDIVTLDGDGRTGIDANRVEAALRADTAGRIKAVLAVQTDTGSGLTSDIPAVRAAMDAAGHPALLVVDAVASLGAIALPMDDWRVDVAISASQKALMGPPGLAFVAANGKAIDHSKTVKRERHYWDWTYRMASEGYRRFCGTTPEHHLFALDAALDLYFAEGPAAVVARHARLASAVRACVGVWAEAGALSFNAVKPEERSNSVTTILTPEGFDSARIRNHARDVRNVACGGGLGPLFGKAFRIGHLGDLNEPMILGALAGVELALTDLGVPHGRGGVRAAIEALTEPV